MYKILYRLVTLSGLAIEQTLVWVRNDGRTTNARFCTILKRVIEEIENELAALSDDLAHVTDRYARFLQEKQLCCVCKLFSPWHIGCWRRSLNSVRRLH